MKTVVLSVFLIGLTVCVSTGATVLWALLLGLFCFVGYAFLQGHPARDVASMLLAGIRQVGNILLIFVLIGMLTAVWRASGTIPFIISNTLPLVNPTYFPLWVFLLCTLLSLLLGTSIGTVSTIGVIFMLLARTAGLNEAVTAGAVMSGIYVGDRCSPMSSSAALVCALTGTNIYDNIRAMWRTSAVPFALACAGYLAFSSGAARLGPKASGRLETFFTLNPWTLLPAACIVILSLCRIEVKRTMLWSILTGCGVCLFVQHMSASDLFRCLVFGYAPAPGMEILAGGGILSMASVTGIVLLSSSYSGIFDATGLLNGFERAIASLARRIGAFRATALVSVPVSAISCNQTLAAILTCRLCRTGYPDRRALALPLENSVILIAALVPWSIACSVPCATLGVGMECLPYALYLYLVPLLYAFRKGA
ncbi:Na+/H+ antiporter NhaC family protein [uncultured Bilophila sp.]|uniref:Na+/H+ antiporter NhaC family protein n=1 Tax=uncultured Bilophila sp. TaxID=529385 RepID=UPI0026DC6700|nr:Na+/H+ antiporter NhaC family protein [uncultured Bilophila sp.]